MSEGMINSSSDSSSNQRFLRLFLESRSQIHGYILFLVPNVTDAEEIFQETAALLWEKFQDYKEGTNFAAWAKKIAMYKTMEFRRRQPRNIFNFDEEVLDKIVEASKESLNLQQEQRRALKKCLNKLCAGDRNLLRIRYEEGLTISRIARKMEKSVHTLYKKMGRIHELLRQCVNRSLTAQGKFE